MGAVGYTYEDVLASLADIGGRDESELIKQTPLADDVAERVVGRRRRETTIKGTFEMSAFPSSTVIVRYATAATRPIRWGLRDGAPLAALIARAQTLEAACVRWLIAYSIAVLRISVGAVFLGFGVLKFFPGVSPAENLVEATTHILTFGLVPGATALVAVATLETLIGLCLLFGRAMRAATYLLVVQLVGILSPIVLLPGRLFSGAGHLAPTLEGQYVLKDIIIVGAALVLAATLNGAHLSTNTN